MCQANEFKAQQLTFPHAHKVNTDTRHSPFALDQEFSILLNMCFCFAFGYASLFTPLKINFIRHARHSS